MVIRISEDNNVFVRMIIASAATCVGIVSRRKISFTDSINTIGIYLILVLKFYTTISLKYMFIFYMIF